MFEETAVITKVERQKKNKRRYNIFIEEQYAFSVHEDVLVKHRLMKGERINREQQEEILRDEERHEVYMKGLRMIGRRPHAEKELKTKLRLQGHDEAVIGSVTDTLQREGYVNDQEFAKLWTEHRILSQRKGRNLVKQELHQKGLSRDHIQEAIGGISEDEELQAALQIAFKKWSQSTGEPYDRRRKTAALLMRRGFTASLINKVLQQISQDADEEHLEDSFMDENCIFNGIN